jgi:hypothetical protein
MQFWSRVWMLLALAVRSLTRVARSIPKWTIGVAGALLAIGATIFTATFVRQLEMSVATKTSEAANVRASISQLWQNHTLADQRETSADIFLSDIALNQQAAQTLLPLIAHNLLGATLAMTAAAAQNVGAQAPTEVLKLENRLRHGDLTAYGEWKSKIDSLRLQSRDVIDTRAKSASTLDSEVRLLRARQAIATQLALLVTVVGLIVALLKDLPIWRPDGQP